MTPADYLYKIAAVTTATRISTHEARAALADVLEDCAKKSTRYVVTLYGREQAAVVPIADLRRLEELDAGSKPAKRRR